ncbi:hypothetical protein NQZ68_004214 [Dissostichus eleginoides]|nr:hypothetical protein NQZ68_004214 [Dissostichus eleginoides]
MSVNGPGCTETTFLITLGRDAGLDAAPPPIPPRCDNTLNPVAQNSRVQYIRAVEQETTAQDLLARVHLYALCT